MIIHNPLEWDETRLGQDEMFGPSTVPRSSKGGLFIPNDDFEPSKRCADKDMFGEGL
jgi:hypothetical protein